MRIGIVPHVRIEGALELTKKITHHLTGEDILFSPEAAEELGEEGTPIEKMDVDSIVTIGGDGTVLYTLQRSPKTPILGINMGNRGFLADVRPGEVMEAIDKLREGELELMEREKLDVEISGEKMGEALNEGVIRSREPSRTLCFRVLIDGEEAEMVEGDGVIVSTPTGSSAYSLAAGGPIMDPRVEANLAVPVCAHRPKSMPLVYPPSSQLEVHLLEPEKEADVTIDGQITRRAEQDDIIRFKRAENCARFYVWRRSFYEKMREKL